MFWFLTKDSPNFKPNCKNSEKKTLPVKLLYFESNLSGSLESSTIDRLYLLALSWERETRLANQIAWRYYVMEVWKSAAVDRLQLLALQFCYCLHWAYFKQTQ